MQRRKRSKRESYPMGLAKVAIPRSPGYYLTADGRMWSCNSQRFLKIQKSGVCGTSYFGIVEYFNMSKLHEEHFPKEHAAMIANSSKQKRRTHRHG
jgi:hypothetical protein